MVKNGITDGVLKRPQKVDLQTFGPKIQQLQQSRLRQRPQRKKARRRRSRASSSPPLSPAPGPRLRRRTQ
jgi:hypothetical protein